MARTNRTTRTTRGDRTGPESLRRLLRREIAGTVGLLSDEHDFAAMRRYRTFAFDDHRTYLDQMEALLRARASQGNHTSVALFDPDEYAVYCDEAGLDPDAVTSRARYTAELAAAGPTVPYDGRPLADLLPELVDESVRQATWEYATEMLAGLGPCPVCGEDRGRLALAHATRLLGAVLGTAASGALHLVCSVGTLPQSLFSVLEADRRENGAVDVDEGEALELTAVLALGLATGSPGGLVTRTVTPGRPDRVYGWRLRPEGLEPLTAGEVFDAYCTDVTTGEPIAPEPDVDYCAPPDLGVEQNHPH
ncbi:hypothetical protein [Streptomyces sp. MJP52]|uniref:hypothetical protein n=1 Tax=Streptomyces sp. MJP52 TaxID=2940555 RepID=UPI002476A86F|nr:hypothetical protein [Streptomyces sp. MJP52]MDH6228004.1 hypothetical protein [Streptomyces sp. MJP52]